MKAAGNDADYLRIEMDDAKISLLQIECPISDKIAGFYPATIVVLGDK